MRVALLQLELAWEDPEANFALARPWIAAAAQAGARLVLLPEMFAYGFSMNTPKVTEPPQGKSTAFLQEEAHKHGLFVGGSLPEQPPGCDKPYNSLTIAAPDGTCVRYRKIHPFTYAGEHERYLAGKDTVQLTIEGVRLSLFVCYDLRFADLFWHEAACTDAYVVVANWPHERRMHWQTLLRARAIENQAYVVGLNRVGRGNNLSYAGDSAVIDPWGETLVQAAKAPTMLLADISTDTVAHARTTFPVLADRQPVQPPKSPE